MRLYVFILTQSTINQVAHARSAERWSLRISHSFTYRNVVAQLTRRKPRKTVTFELAESSCREVSVLGALYWFYSLLLIYNITRCSICIAARQYLPICSTPASQCEVRTVSALVNRVHSTNWIFDNKNYKQAPVYKYPTAFTHPSPAIKMTIIGTLRQKKLFLAILGFENEREWNLAAWVSTWTCTVLQANTHLRIHGLHSGKPQLPAVEKFQWMIDNGEIVTYTWQRVHKQQAHA